MGTRRPLILQMVHDSTALEPRCRFQVLNISDIFLLLLFNLKACCFTNLGFCFGTLLFWVLKIWGSAFCLVTGKL